MVELQRLLWFRKSRAITVPKNEETDNELIEKRFYASVKKVASNYPNRVREQHDIRGGGIKIGGHAAFFHPFHYFCSG